MVSEVGCNGHISSCYTPGPFNFAKPEEWPKWLKRFERFRQASELCKKTEESQVNTLLYSMGEKADDILQSFNIIKYVSTYH